MKKIVIAVAAVCLVSASVQAEAVGSMFGNLSSARTIGQGRGNFGGGVGIADATSVFGRFTYGTSQYSELRLKLGIVDDEGIDAELGLGADFQYHFMEVQRDSQGRVTTPLDMAGGALFEWVDLGPVSVLQLGAFITASHPFAMQNGSTLSPYGRLNVRIESVSYDGPLDNQTDLRFGFHGGVKWAVTNLIDLYGEFQLDGNDGLFLGIDFNVM